MESVIKWQTGEPKENGTYLVSTLDGFIEVSNWGTCAWDTQLSDSVIAWCKLSDIEPYKE